MIYTGGLLGLCLGFSFISGIEIIYWLCCFCLGFTKNCKENGNQPKEVSTHAQQAMHYRPDSKRAEPEQNPANNIELHTPRYHTPKRIHNSSPIQI